MPVYLVSKGVYTVYNQSIEARNEAEALFKAKQAADNTWKDVGEADPPFYQIEGEE